MGLALSRQSTPVLVELYKRIYTKVDSKGNVSPLAVKLLMYLQGRGYDIHKLIQETQEIFKNPSIPKSCVGLS
jgi:hypothetical protein